MKRVVIHAYSVVIAIEAALLVTSFVTHRHSWGAESIPIGILLAPFVLLMPRLRKRLADSHPGIDAATPMILVGFALGLAGFFGALVDITHTAPSLMLGGAYVQSIILWLCSRTPRKSRGECVGGPDGA